ncbi:hypothetical protein QBC38DRAFT_527296 [Podospora fimiseda]|uniref:Uncharacterized protein n=1 Tax=Podospora fimiseda TaxID=252190 RepID=A0AAN7H5C7_9PEZI|nr:hypothetical protein QBC38DRAFT_527296 [Podospora fimiseda]
MRGCVLDRLEQDIELTKALMHFEVQGDCIRWTVYAVTFNVMHHPIVEHIEDSNRGMWHGDRVENVPVGMARLGRERLGELSELRVVEGQGHGTLTVLMAEEIVRTVGEMFQLVQTLAYPILPLSYVRVIPKTAAFTLCFERNMDRSLQP